MALSNTNEVKGLDFFDEAFSEITPQLDSRFHQEEIIIRLDKMIDIYERKIVIDRNYRLLKLHRVAGHVILNDMVPIADSNTYRVCIRSADDNHVLYMDPTLCDSVNRLCISVRSEMVGVRQLDVTLITPGKRYILRPGQRGFDYNTDTGLFEIY